jgi:hypothetical protein
MSEKVIFQRNLEMQKVEICLCLKESRLVDSWGFCIACHLPSKKIISLEGFGK